MSPSDESRDRRAQQQHQPERQQPTPVPPARMVDLPVEGGRHVAGQGVAVAQRAGLDLVERAGHDLRPLGFTTIPSLANPLSKLPPSTISSERHSQYSVS